MQQAQSEAGWGSEEYEYVCNRPIPAAGGRPKVRPESTNKWPNATNDRTDLCMEGHLSQIYLAKRC